MTLRIVTLAAVFAVAAASAPLAQSTTAPTPMPSLDQRGQQTPPPTGQRGQTPPAPAQNMVSRGSRVDRNVKLDLTIVDTYTGKPVSKTVSMMLASGYSGRIRTQNVINNRYPVELNVDATAEVTANASGIRVHLTFEYNPAPEPAQAEANPVLRPASLNESFVVLLDDGKPLMVTRSADPATDRSVTVELTATIQR
jgi:hypothetical protein